MNRLINMILRRVMNRLMRAGVTKGADHLAKRGKGGKPLSAKERQQSKENARRAQQAMRMIRRFGRF
jgi:hypothetical protein